MIFTVVLGPSVSVQSLREMDVVFLKLLTRFHFTCQSFLVPSLHATTVCADSLISFSLNLPGLSVVLQG